MTIKNGFLFYSESVFLSFVGCSVEEKKVHDFLSIIYFSNVYRHHTKYSQRFSSTVPNQTPTLHHKTNTYMPQDPSLIK